MKTADKAIIDTMAAPRSILGRIQRELFGFDMATTNLPKNLKLEEKEAEKSSFLGKLFSSLGKLLWPRVNGWRHQYDMVYFCLAMLRSTRRIWDVTSSRWVKRQKNSQSEEPHFALELRLLLDLVSKLTHLNDLFFFQST